MTFRSEVALFCQERHCWHQGCGRLSGVVRKAIRASTAHLIVGSITALIVSAHNLMVTVGSFLLDHMYSRKIVLF